MHAPRWQSAGLRIEEGAAPACRPGSKTASFSPLLAPGGLLVGRQPWAAASIASRFGRSIPIDPLVRAARSAGRESGTRVPRPLTGRAA